jgi:L-threonylcarbamoyladenylate synthase
MGTDIYSVDVEKPETDIINEIALRLFSGEVGIFPSDTIYGISCLSFFKSSVNRIQKIKNWDKPRAMILLIQSLNVARWMGLEVDEKIEILASKLVDIPFTMILPTICSYDPYVKRDNGVAVRIVKSPFLKILFTQINSSVFSTSVNIKGKKIYNQPDEIKKKFKKKVDFIVDGGLLEISTPSTIIDFTDIYPEIVREGYETERIKKVLREIFK